MRIMDGTSRKMDSKKLKDMKDPQNQNVPESKWADAKNKNIRQ